MIVYVKSFNRPFYLDRCLQSVKALARGVERVVVLDDGTEEVFLEHLRRQHPDVEFRRSGGQGKWQLVREQAFEEIRSRFVAPHAFWLKELHADQADYFCLLEDDTWLTRSLDLGELHKLMRGHKLSNCRLFWGEGGRTPAQQTVGVKPLENGASLVMETARPGNLDDVWGFFIVCMSVFERGFYELAHAGVRDYLDEPAILANVKRELEAGALPRIMSRLSARAVCQGWAIPGRSDVKYYAMGVRQHVFVDLLNSLWLDGLFDPLHDFPKDFDLDWLCGLFAERLPPLLGGEDKAAEAVAAYRRWRESDPGARAFPGMSAPRRLEHA